MGDYAEQSIEDALFNEFIDPDFDDSDRDDWGPFASSGYPKRDGAAKAKQREKTRRKNLKLIPAIGEKIRLSVPEWLMTKHRLSGTVAIGVVVAYTEKAVLVKRKTKDHWFPLGWVEILEGGK